MRRSRAGRHDVRHAGALQPHRAHRSVHRSNSECGSACRRNHDAAHRSQFRHDLFRILPVAVAPLCSSICSGSSVTGSQYPDPVRLSGHHQPCSIPVFDAKPTSVTGTAYAMARLFGRSVGRSGRTTCTRRLLLDTQRYFRLCHLNGHCWPHRGLRYSPGPRPCGRSISCSGQRDLLAWVPLPVHRRRCDRVVCQRRRQPRPSHEPITPLHFHYVLLLVGVCQIAGFHESVPETTQTRCGKIGRKCGNFLGDLRQRETSPSS